MNIMKNTLGMALVLALAAPAGCAKDAGGAISVVSREDGSGTRGAFIELLAIEQKDADGNKADHTTGAAEITDSTAVRMTTAPAQDGMAVIVSPDHELRGLTARQVREVFTGEVASWNDVR